MSNDLNELICKLKDAVQVSDILKLNKDLDKLDAYTESIKWGISANITLDQIEITLKKHGFLNQRKTTTVMGAFDSHLENIELFKNNNVDHVLFLNFFDSLLPSLESRVLSLSSELISDLKSKIKHQLSIISNSSSHFKSLFIPLLHRMGHPAAIEANDGINSIVDDFNEMIKSLTKDYSNITLIDMDPIISSIGRNDSFNTRFYYKFKSPYSVAFVDALSRNLLILLRGGGSYFYKALVLDCDNTLWGGIIGEDLIGGIKLGPHEYPDNIFWTIQNEIIALKNSGVLLVLCSKNNAADVDEVLEKHEYSAIRNEHIILKKVNWTDKAENLRQIAKELNIGLESLVFLDDSEFECNSIRMILPQVKTIQVPKNIFEYPQTFQKVKELFVSKDQTKDASDKTEQYRIRALAIQEEAKYTSEEDYLTSLGLKVKLRKNQISSVSRISELSQKSNQFNVTTKRYSVQEITSLMTSKESAVYSLEVSDKFGDSGLTGVAIVKYVHNSLVIDSFLMSCRVIGRGVEFMVWETIFNDAIKNGCSVVEAEYIKSQKNILVENFFDKLGFPAPLASEQGKKYHSAIVSFTNLNKTYIEVSYEY